MTRLHLTRLHLTLDLDLVGAPADLAAAARVIAERLEIEARYLAGDNHAAIGLVASAFSITQPQPAAAAP